MKSYTKSEASATWKLVQFPARLSQVALTKLHNLSNALYGHTVSIVRPRESLVPGEASLHITIDSRGELGLGGEAVPKDVNVLLNACHTLVVIALALAES